MPKNKIIFDNFSNLLQDWHNELEREIPWKGTKSPYKIWLSEVLLQQTRLKQGIPYYQKFIKRFPTIFELANSNLDEIFSLWKGLGYYRRAEYLFFSAQLIVNKFNGEFPKSYKELQILKGVGKNTAAAIASFAYEEEVPIIDGNVQRVIARIFNISQPIDTAIGRSLIEINASKLIKNQVPSKHNQLMMDFGATICIPKIPKCKQCPITTICNAFENGNQHILPLKKNKVKKKNRNFAFFLIQKEDKYFLQKRKGDDIWKGLYQFPMVEFIKQEEIILKADKEIFQGNLSKIEKIVSFNQNLTHQNIKSYFFAPILKDFHTFGSKQLDLFSNDELEKLPTPKTIDWFIQNFIKTKQL